MIGETPAMRLPRSRNRDRAILSAVIFFFLFPRSSAFPQTQPAAVSDSSHAASYVGSAACGKCHASIYNSYQQTPMAHASGPATEGLKPAAFVHKKSGVHYQIFTENSAAWLTFDRPGDPTVNGKRQLLYFIGSGHRGRSYLFAVDDFFFESPINWYAGRKVWDMAPAYENAREMPLNLPAYSSCLECHTSGMQPPLKGTANEYPLPPFAQNGVGCERCHGPGSEHLKAGPIANRPIINRSIVNPSKLSADRRDSVCMQCHLEGNVAIERPGRHVYDFRPGDLLDDYVRHYVLTGNDASVLGANSQFEALAQSACKKKSGDSMPCVSCHNPHESPAPEQRAAYFRGKCLTCHGEPFAARHHPESLDCTSCHMPSSLSTDISHTEVTDHRIRRRPELSANLLEDSSPAKPNLKLVPFPDSSQAEGDSRDLALAWQSAAENGVRGAAVEAVRLFPQAIKESPDDPVLLSGFAFAELNRGAVNHSRELYEKALSLDPTLIDAATNLGVIEAKAGHQKEAIALWQKAFEHAPTKSGIGMNLARVLCEEGKTEEAKKYVLRVLRFNPDLSEARKLSQQLNASPPGCGP